MNDTTRIDLATTAPFRIGALCVEPALRRVSTAESETETLEPRVMLVLVALARAGGGGGAGGGIVSRDQLIEQCWDSRVVGDDSINRVISRLRKLAGAHGDDT
ncbi:MAG: winged helix-turn-helix domain-containing protein, partial [Novosphingobium sp.]|nr:winged helix-turn-helix domain-containing protein [Novosphingobium sp.]